MGQRRAAGRHVSRTEQTPASDISYTSEACRHDDAVFAVNIASGGARAMSASKDNTVRMFHVNKSGSDHEIGMKMPPGIIVDVCMNDKIVAVTYEHDAVHVFQMASPHEEVFSRHDLNVVCVKLSLTGKTLVSASKKLVVVTNLATRQDVFSYPIPQPHDSIYRLSVNDKASKIFILTAEGHGSSTVMSSYVQIWDPKCNDYYRPSFPISSHFYADISVDETGTLLCIADDNSLIIWDGEKNASVSLPQYEAPNGENTCAMTRCGKFVVAAIANNDFGLWNCIEQVKLATFRTHIPIFSDNPSSCAISDDGRTIIGGCCDYAVRVWSFSQLEHAFIAALAKPDLVDMNYILDNIRSENINSATDLFLGHNLVLLAIRTGIITKENIETLGGTQFFLERQLYNPATKLTKGNGKLIDAVFCHAGKIGLIQDSYGMIRAREIRGDVEKGLMGIGDSIVALSHRLHAVEQRVHTLEGHYDGLASSMETLALDQRRMQEGICDLANSLTQLQENIRQRDKRMKYATVVRCMLSFVPLLGKALGEVAYAATEILQDLTVDDVVGSGVEIAKWMVSHSLEVDLGNFHVARYMFSEEALSQLDESVREGVDRAVEQSEIGSYAELSTLLNSEMSRIETNDKLAASLDANRNIWNVDATASAVTDQEWTRIESMGRAKFAYAIQRQGESADALQLAAGKKALNELLNDAPCLDTVEDLETRFLDVVGRDIVNFSEETFILVLQGIYEEQKHIKQFRKYATNNVVSLEIATRLIRNIGKETLSRRQGVFIPQKDDVRKVLTNLVRDGDRYIDEKGFVAAVKKLL